MLLQKRNIHWRTMIMIGQLNLSGGLTIMLLNWYFMLGYKIGTILPVLSGNFYQGFLTGLSGAAIGISIVFNIQGLLKWRKETKIA